MTGISGNQLEAGTRVGRFVVLRDVGGHTHAVAATGVNAACETDDGTLLLLPGGRMIHVPQDLETVLRWLDGDRPSGSARRSASIGRTR